VGGTPVPLPAPPPPGAALPGVVLPDEGQGGPEAPASSTEGVYTVEKGDSLGLIAQKTLGTTRKAGEIAKFNGMSIDAPLKVGQELKIPPQVPAALAGTATTAPPPPATASPSAAPVKAPAAKRAHTVGRGDSLFGLAKRYYGDGSRFRAIAEANGLDPDAPLKVGSELRLP
jgi:nucleoid-associated protein YgaU